MSQPTVAAEVHQPLDVHGDLASQVALNDIVAVDDFADLQHLLVGQLRPPPGVRDPDLRHDFIGLFRPDPMDILQSNDDALIGRYIDAGDAGHSHSLLLPPRSKRPALVSARRFASDNATPSPFRSARYRSTSRLGCGLLRESSSVRQTP